MHLAMLMVKIVLIDMKVVGKTVSLGKNMNPGTTSMRILEERSIIMVQKSQVPLRDMPREVSRDEAYDIYLSGYYENMPFTEYGMEYGFLDLLRDNGIVVR